MDTETEGSWMGRMVGGATAVVTFTGAVIGVLVGLDRLGWLSIPGFAEASAEAEEEEPAPLQVTAAIAQVDPEGHTGQCPATFSFRGEITTTGGSGTISYRWVRSHGEPGPVQTLDVHGADSYRVSSEWSLGEPGWTEDGQYWQQLEIVEPAPRASPRAEFVLRCPK